STLRRMRRRYTPAMFLKWARRWREIRPDGGLTTDIIVGFPGETDTEFEASLEVARAAKFSAVHVFPYSPRAGTAAAVLPGLVAPAVQNRRVAALLQLGNELSREYSAQFIGRTLPVLIETISGDGSTAEGLIPHYVRACVAMPPESYVAAGDICRMQVHAWRDGTLEGVWQR
ncbi:MAG TPA: hypothetical protein VNA16_03140, partial [Abditibacteriaceae bacterium]|nr:hypothetical protein [Abditibacteriaceae bacterium]